MPLKRRLPTGVCKGRAFGFCSGANSQKKKEVLRRTLKSLENQLYKNFEVVIVEDGENTAENMVKSDFPSLNINYFATGENVGRGRAGNT